MNEKTMADNWSFRKLHMELEGKCPHCKKAIIVYFKLEEDNDEEE